MEPVLLPQVAGQPGDYHDRGAGKVDDRVVPYEFTQTVGADTRPTRPESLIGPRRRLG